MIEMWRDEGIISGGVFGGSENSFVIREWYLWFLTKEYLAKEERRIKYEKSVWF